jgi:hypothetical protein
MVFQRLSRRRIMTDSYYTIQGKPLALPNGNTSRCKIHHTAQSAHLFIELRSAPFRLHELGQRKILAILQEYQFTFFPLSGKAAALPGARRQQRKPKKRSRVFCRWGDPNAIIAWQMVLAPINVTLSTLTLGPKDAQENDVAAITISNAPHARNGLACTGSTPVRIWSIGYGGVQPLLNRNVAACGD